MRKRRNGTIAQWKGKDGRSKSIRCWWDKRGSFGKWWLFPTVHIDHVFDPLTVSFHFLKFNIEYHSVMSYTVDEFKEMLNKRGVDISKAKPGYFEL